MADGFVDKVLDIITKSEKIGFAAAFAGGLFFSGRHYGFKPFTEVEQPMVGYILYGTLVGAGLLVARALIWIGEKIGNARDGISTWSQRRLAPMRLNELLPDELTALVWLLHHKYNRASVNRYDAPFAGLVRKGFLEPSDGSEGDQVLFVNANILKHREEILKKFSNYETPKINSSRPPWEHDPSDWMRV